MTGTIFNIQHYAVHDGPGIRTLVFLKGCPLHCTWCCNPESHASLPQLRHIAFRCKSCLACVAACPSRAVTVSDRLPVYNFNICRNCLSKPCTEHCDHDALTITGREIGPAELTEILALDIPFYRNSGGGVTFSGGEPLMQPAFLAEVLRRCKNMGIHTAVETCGWASREAFEEILPFTDLFLYDLKIMDPALHLEYTGVPLEPVLDNLGFLISQKAGILIRLPLVRGITDTPSNMEAVAVLMLHAGLDRISLQPFHNLGMDKYREHGMEYRPGQLEPFSHDQLACHQSFFLRQGISCEVD
jgi:pyruvate formate lyase activating enzyme